MKIGLGTVQFGQDYGISNKEGKPSNQEIKKIINQAYLTGVRLIDTAPAYNCEKLMGNLLGTIPDIKIITKTESFWGSAIGKTELDTLEGTFKNSLLKLKQGKVYGLLAHNCDDLLKPGGGLFWNKMLDFKLEGFVEKIGASVYTGEQIDALLENYQMDIIQLPVNVLDQRLIKSGQLKKLKSIGVEIHARSIFLQGLLFMDPDSIHPYFEPIKQYLINYHSAVKQNRMTPLEGALCFIESITEIDVAIIGINTLQHLLDTYSYVVNRKDIPINVYADCICDEERFLNPSKWNLA